MDAVDLLIDGDPGAPTLILAHGAGASMDARGMTDLALRISGHGIRVVRFEFDYMARRRSGVRRPPPRADTLLDEYRAVVAQIGGRPVIGGRSMGGRVASMIADEQFAAGRVSGLACLSYPWHPPGRPDQPRTSHLIGLLTPALVVQGTRDPFGSPEEVASYGLPAIDIVWLPDGDHDLRPRKAVSGLSAAQHLETAADAVASFVSRVA
jgi:predicted alpha/beta-hydrolase family hydrolase